MVTFFIYFPYDNIAESELNPFLILALDAVLWSASHSTCFAPGIMPPVSIE
jgi:hypothetical protein